MAIQIALPRDAEGREIPLDTKVLYDKDDTELTVRSLSSKAIAITTDGRCSVL